MSLPLPGASANDLRNLPNNWKKSIAIERLFLPTFFSCSKKVGWTKGFILKMAWVPVYRKAHALNININRPHN
ncbi:hypothetical protein GPSY_4178 [Paraglaciecola psychrophila 170]|nr:hypothetical protein GPSY_4178 [Paraglaciecola psychrophila 170]